MIKYKSVLGNFRRDDIIEKILQNLQIDESRIIEITGTSGTGKTHLYRNLREELKRQKIECLRFFPRQFKFNNFALLLEILCGVKKQELIKYAEKAQIMKVDMKYDFFYFLTEALSQEKRLQSKLVIVDDFDLLDQYTKDFVQYICNYDKSFNIKFVVFNTKEMFANSIKIKIDYLSHEEISSIISGINLQGDLNKDVSADILQNITGGNVYLLESLLRTIAGKNDYNLTDYFEVKITVSGLYEEKLNEISDDLKQIMCAIYLLEDQADVNNINIILQKEISLDKFDQLVEEGLIYFDTNHYRIAKHTSFQVYLTKFRKKDLCKLYKQAMALSELVSCLKQPKYYYDLDIYDEEVYSEIERELLLLKDFENLQLVYSKMLEMENNSRKKAKIFEKMGIAYEKLNNIEAAAEFFRQALKITSEYGLPVEEIIYHLVTDLNSINSHTFALEIIRKYSPESIDYYWKCRIIMQKAQILLDLENIEEGMSELDKLATQIRDIENERDRIFISAERKRLLGKFNYFQNNMNLADENFKEAEKLYSSIDDYSGIAAVANNLGVVVMSHGDWKEAERFFLKSIEFEKKVYNQNGISVCYNNLGGLMCDMGELTKSLYYLNEALKIQSMFNDRYKITFIYHNIGVTCMENGMYRDAENAFKNALEISLSFNLYRNIVASYYHLGALNFKTGKWKKAIDYYELAIAKSQENNFLEGMCKAYNNLGELYEKRSEYNLAYDLYFKGVEILPDVKDDFLKAELYGNLGSVLTHLHNYGEAYPYLVESYDYFKSLDAKDKIIEANQKYAFYFIQTRNFESAAYYINSAIKTAKELKMEFELGKAYYIRSFLQSSKNEAINDIKLAIELFIKTNNNFELALTNYHYANLLAEGEDTWEQALQILSENKKIIKEFDSISLLEKNDYLINKITKDRSVELKESKYHESLLSKFYEITEKLNLINDFDNLLVASLDLLVEISESDGGILCLYNLRDAGNNWEYKIFNSFSEQQEDADEFFNVITETFENNKTLNYQQPHFAANYNSIISFPLRIRNKTQGVILLFCKHGNHYFTKKIINLISALCNQVIVTIENLRQCNLEKSHAIIREELLTASNFTNIVGKSSRIERIFELIEKIKDTPTTVLIEGESGTGKELIARAIHFNSNRKNKKFVAQYCGALPETLLESELFGHVKGSFTGAAYDKKGLFEIADGGTFFLDEIGDISLSIQAKLLRFLQEGEIKRVGSTKTNKVDVRVICATNVSLKQKVEKGEFRLDLYYRLNVIKIDMPSLKERKSDIPLLAIHFLDKYNKRVMKDIKGITDETMKHLVRCDWPGNVRQLENEIERAVTLAEPNSFIRPVDLSEEVFKLAQQKETIDILEVVPLKDALEKLEIQMINDALERSGWNQTRAAKELGLSRQGLIKKMKRYGFDKIDES
ncbi:MAG: sigma 54-interacting transcriptional regulator [Candidatus Cloacimonetes bacterium]|nr:sigma 54-interacting transcriptional regulator [Candidatus Cloacimonadota bacterium]